MQRPCEEGVQTRAAYNLLSPMPSESANNLCFHAHLSVAKRKCLCFHQRRWIGHHVAFYVFCFHRYRWIDRSFLSSPLLGRLVESFIINSQSG